MIVLMGSGGQEQVRLGDRARHEARAETKKERPNAPISRRLLRLLRAASRVSNGEYVIMRRGGPVLSVKKAVTEACRRAKLKGVTPHTMKHTYITWLLHVGVPVWQVAGLTNTSPATITKIYGHHVQDGLREAANAIRQLVPKFPKPLLMVTG